MTCATLAIAITILAHPNARPAFSEAVFDEVTAQTSKALLRAGVKVARQGDIDFNRYGHCVSVRFTLKPNEQQLQFDAHALTTARSNLDPFREPAADDPDFRDVDVGGQTGGYGRTERAGQTRMSLRFDWVSKIAGHEYRLYRLDLSGGGEHGLVTVDPKISNSGIS